MSKIDFSKPPSMDEGGLLAKIWRDIVDKNYLIHKFDYLISEYVSKNNNQNQVIRRKNKHTLTTNVCSSAMTWKVFLENLELSRFKSVEITVKVTDQNGHSTTHILPINMTRIGELENDKTSNEQE